MYFMRKFLLAMTVVEESDAFTGAFECSALLLIDARKYNVGALGSWAAMCVAYPLFSHNIAQ